MHPTILSDVKKITNQYSNILCQLSGAKILITGAGGMIASYVMDILAFANKTILQEHPVHLIGVTRKKVSTNSRLGNLLGREDVSWITADLTKPFDMPHGVTHIIHAASWADPKRYLASPIEVMDTNVIGTRYLLEYAATHHTTRFLLVSSSEVYGSPNLENIPTPESYIGIIDPIGTRSCYAEAKRYAECLSMHFYRFRNVPSVIARLSHTYGPGQSLEDSRVIAAFMRYAINHHDIEIFNEGNEERTFCYAADTAMALIFLLVSGKNGEVYNVGSENPLIAIRQLAELITNEFNNTIGIRHIFDQTKQLYLKGAPIRVQPNIDKIKGLGWMPHTSLTEGIKNLRQWMEYV